MKIFNSSGRAREIEMSEESRRARAISLYGTADPQELERKRAELVAKAQAGLEQLNLRQRLRQDAVEAVMEELWQRLGVNLLPPRKS